MTSQAAACYCPCRAAAACACAERMLTAKAAAADGAGGCGGGQKPKVVNCLLKYAQGGQHQLALGVPLAHQVQVIKGPASRRPIRDNSTRTHTRVVRGCSCATDRCCCAWYPRKHGLCTARSPGQAALQLQPCIPLVLVKVWRIVIKDLQQHQLAL